MKKNEKIIIIDGNSLASRAFYALPLLKTSQGQYTNAVYGFTNMLLRLLEEERPEYMVVTFDMAAPTFRHEAYKEYKAQREESPTEYREQIPLIKEVLEALSIPIFEMEGYEADDLIGTYCKKAEEEGLESLIVTGDADAFQLISSRVKVLMTRKGISNIERIDQEKLQEKYGLKPEQVADYKAMKGDPTDNIPGIPGVGEKTALKLLKEFGSLDNLLENVHQVKENKLRKKIEENRDQVLISRELATIMTEVEDGFNLQDCRISEEDRDYFRTREIFENLEFKSLLEKLPSSTREEKEDREEGTEYILIDSKEKLEDLAKELDKNEDISLLLEVTHANSFKADMAGITLGRSPREVYFVPLMDMEKEKNLNKDEVLQALKPVLENKGIKKICPDGKLVMNILKLEGINLEGLHFDPYIAVYLLAPGKPVQSISQMAEEFLGSYVPSREEILGKGAKAKKITELETVELKDLSCREGSVLFKLAEVLKEKLREMDLENLFLSMELPLVKVLSAMELEGIKIDEEKLLEMSREVRGKIKKVEKEIYSLANQEFNLNSPKQLSFILFEKLNLPVIKKTKTGYSTDAEVLEELASHHEVVEKILLYRQLIKLQGTYLDGLLELINPDTGKIHTTFKQNITATGRLSSTDPNLQNIPVRLEEARRIRKVFIPQDQEAFLLAADYSQIELRILAHISGDQQLIDSFLRDEDIHQRTASEIFEIPLEQVTPSMRSSAKTVNFGIVYGMSDYGLSQNLRISRQEARSYIQNYFEKYPGVKEYTDKVIAQARQDGYVTTLLSRRRYLPDINHRNRNIRSFAERTAINTPIQGSAADLIKMAMVTIYEELIDNNFYNSKMLLQVHDELIFEVPSQEVSELSKRVKEKMERVYHLMVPLKVDLKVGKNWFDMEKIV